MRLLLEDQRQILCLALLALSFILVVPNQSALAHPGQPPEPHDIWLAWNGCPSLLLALETADVALMGDDLSKLPFAVGLGRATRAVIPKTYTSRWG